MKAYDHKKIEKKWQDVWEKTEPNKALTSSPKKKFYPLIEFPYPSGTGLHVGHIRSNTAMDIIARKRRMEGFNVLYPIGWDAFGLPTENYAIKTGVHPEIVTKQNTDNFRKQLKSLGFSFDWSREINTTDPKYYKWTQWIFLQFFKKGLAYKAKRPINWCLSCKVGLADEEVIDGHCERCGGPTEKREKEQWMLAITKYAERLDKDLDDVNYLEKIKIQQRNWIGKSEGSEIEFKIENLREHSEHLSSQGEETKIKVFTTRADTLFGVTYLVIAPEHELVKNLASRVTNADEVNKYIQAVKKKTEIERTDAGKEKTGVELQGLKAINPANGEEIPVFIADYVLAHYGTGAIMAVPAHDERDFEFAKKFGLSIKRVIEPVYIGKEEGAPKVGEKFVKRDAVCVVLKNPKDDTYLCNVWKTSHMQGLLTGGIEDGEDVVEAATREIKEESGYRNVRFINDPKWTVNTFFYHQQKKQNRWARFRYLYFELENEERDAVDQVEAEKHEFVWKKKEELKDFFSVFEGRFLLNILDNPDYCYLDLGYLGNSGEFDGLSSEEAKNKITEFVGGTIKTTFKLRDWVFSRQRYWGEPIPVIHCPKCGYVPVPEIELPVELPNVENYTPTDDGESPLSAITEWVNVACPACKGPAKRETDTMPNWAGSSWYYLRYADPDNSNEFASKEALGYFTPVDWYNGGMEHTTLHLLYSRFWHKFLYDLGLVPTAEPYAKRTSHGLILADDGSKFSKSKGNGVTPADVIEPFGADSVRLYEMFMGPFDQAVAWDSNGIVGVRRFVEKVWRLQEKAGTSGKEENKKIKNLLHKTLKKVSEDIEEMKFNTAISSMMILVNELDRQETIEEGIYKTLLMMLAPFTPHVTEEIWQNLGSEKSIHLESWPAYDPKLITEDEVTIAVQIDGKVRATFTAQAGLPQAEIQETALGLEVVKKWLPEGGFTKVFYVKDRLINFLSK